MRCRASLTRMMRFALALLLGCLSVSSAQAARSVKGWELYSWSDQRCSAKPHYHVTPRDAVCFALLPGTNRLKTTAEIMKRPLTLAELQKRIDKLARDEDV